MQPSSQVAYSLHWQHALLCQQASSAHIASGRKAAPMAAAAHLQFASVKSNTFKQPQDASIQGDECICVGVQASQLRASCGQRWTLSWHRQQAAAPTSTHLQTPSKITGQLLLELSSFQQMLTPLPSTARAPSHLKTTRTAQSGAKQPLTPWGLWGTALGWPSPPPVSFWTGILTTTPSCLTSATAFPSLLCRLSLSWIRQSTTWSCLTLQLTSQS